MLDVGRIVALILAFAWCVRARARFAPAAVLVVAYVFALEIAGGILARGDARLHAGYAFALVFLGPSSLPRTLPGALPLAGLVVKYGAAVNIFTSTCLLGPWRGLERRSMRLYPESEEARLVDRAALQLVLVIVLDLIVACSQLLLAALARD